MSKEYESKTEHKENLIDIAGLFDDLIKGIIQMKWRFLIILVICVQCSVDTRDLLFPILCSIFHIYDQFQYYIREF